jgi:hypothetical protein
VLDARELATAENSGTLYVTVGSGDPRYPNSLVAFESGSTAVAWSALVGGEPGPVAVSDAGDVVWVGLQGAPAALPVDTLNHAAGARFLLGHDPQNGDLYPTQLHALPGAGASVALTAHFLLTDAVPGLFVLTRGCRVTRRARPGRRLSPT